MASHPGLAHTKAQTSPRRRMLSSSAVFYRGIVVILVHLSRR